MTRSRLLFVYATCLMSLCFTNQAEAQTPLKWAIPVESLTAEAFVNQQPLRPGDEFVLAVRLQIEPGWHVYANPKGPSSFGQAANLSAKGPAAFSFEKALYPKGERFNLDAKSLGIAEADAWNWVYHNEAILYLPGRVNDDAAAGETTIELQLRGQVCYDQQCVPLNGKAELAVKVAAAQSAVETQQTEIFAGLRALSAAPPSDRAPPLPASRPAAANPAPDEPAWDVANAPAASGGFWAYVASCFGFGLVAALTPCFYPMFPVTVSFFLKQGQKKGARPLVLAGVYSLTIVGAFTIAGVIFGNVLTKVGANPFLNLFFALLLVAFGMALIGMFEIPVPQRLVRWSSKGEARGGMWGVMFMALTLLIVGTPCIAPFFGPVLLEGTTMSGQSLAGVNVATATGALSFSLALAIPFFGLALAPSLMGKLPKSGGWMTTVKMVMGFLLLGLSFKYFKSADAVWGLGLLHRNLVLSIWVALALVVGLYLLGLLRTHHDTPTQGISGGRMLLGTGFLSAAMFLGSGFVQPLPETIDAMLPSGTLGSTLSAVGGESEKLSWKDTTFDEALTWAGEENLPAFLDFTGVTCYNCELMEKTIFPRPGVVERLQKMVRAKLYTDRYFRPGDEKNSEILYERFQSIGPPFYAVMSPQGEVLGTFAGLTKSEAKFVAFLEQALAKWKPTPSSGERATVGIVNR